MRKKKYHIDEQGSDGYVSLGNAIIKAATDDYEDCLIRLKNYPFDDDAKNEMKEIEKFFHSRFYGILTNLDGEMILRKLREKYGL